MWNFDRSQNSVIVDDISIKEYFVSSLFFFSFYRHYEDDFEPDEDEIVNEEKKSSVADRVSQNSRALSEEDDIYDFSTDSLGY